ncbi:nucleotidyl transferase AbiEii/AbiGii toxin family protein [Scytonema sp. NUACC21]
MSRKPLSNVPASIRSRLLNLAKERKEDFSYLLSRYASDRFLYRLSLSRYHKQFILKGATLFRVWNGEPHRATKDLDLLSFGVNEIPHLVEIFKEICCIKYEQDGILFQEETVVGEKIKEDQEYEGVRIKLKGILSNTPVPLQIDVGFGDAVTPTATEASFPTILSLPVPVMQIYPRETVVSEKFQAMVSLGIKNSRLKDFYDILFLCGNFNFEGVLLSQAIQATFQRRKTSIPNTEPFALTVEFAEDSDKKKQWEAFVKKAGINVNQNSLNEVIDIIKSFLMPPCLAVSQNQVFNQIWTPAEGWQVSDFNSIPRS